MAKTNLRKVSSKKQISKKNFPSKKQIRKITKATNSNSNSKLVTFGKEQIWTGKDGKTVYFTLLPSNRVQRIERSLRGRGAEPVDPNIATEYYPKIKIELEARGLSMLEDHPNAVARDVQKMETARKSSQSISELNSKLRVYLDPDVLIPSKFSGFLYCRECKCDIPTARQLVQNHLEIHRSEIITKYGIW